MPFIGQEPIIGGFHKLDSITTSSTNAYDLLLNGSAFFPESANHLMVSLNGVIQSPGDSFTVSGSQITFVPSSGTLSSSDSIDFIMAYGNVLNIGTPSDGTVTSAKLDTNIAVSGTFGVTGESTLTGGAKVNTIKHTGGTTGLTIDSSGVVSQPARPSFVLMGIPNNTIASQATIVWGQSSFTPGTQSQTNGGFSYDSSNGYLTVPKTGLYQINIVFKVRAAASAEVYFNLEGSTDNFSSDHKYFADSANGYIFIHEFPQTQQGWQTITIAGVTNLIATEKLRVKQATSFVVTVPGDDDNGGYWSGFYIG